MCPVCNVVCSLEKIDDLSDSINLSYYIPIRDPSKDLGNTLNNNHVDNTQYRSPVFSFPRQIRESEGGGRGNVTTGKEFDCFKPP